MSAATYFEHLADLLEEIEEKLKLVETKCEPYQHELEGFGEPFYDELQGYKGDLKYLAGLGSKIYGPTSGLADFLGLVSPKTKYRYVLPLGPEEVLYSEQKLNLEEYLNGVIEWADYYINHCDQLTQ